GFFAGTRLQELSDRIHVIPMGIELPESATGPGDPHHALIVARLVEKKGIDVLLDAWPQVVSQVPDAVLTIAGDGPLRDHLSKRVGGLGLDIRMPGYVTGDSKADAVAAAGIVVQPSVVAADGDADGLPVALLEGLAAGRIGVA